MNVSVLSGETLEGKYRLGGCLGKGNFGAVFKAVEMYGGLAVRDVALKIYSPEATVKGDVEGMFEDCAFPARILASSSPINVKQHFVEIFGWGRLQTSIGDCAYVSMELVRNAVTMQDLTDRHNRSGSRPTESEVIEKMRQFFTALAEAHRADVLHRDIKGENVLISNKVVKLVDFGMGARISMRYAPLKTTRHIFTPENFKGKHYKESDIYQAGLMFFKYWTGVQPFEKTIARKPDETDEAYDNRAKEEEERLRRDWRYIKGSDMGCEGSEKLDAILSKCLRFSINERYGDATIILRDLDTEKEGAFSAREAFENGDFDYAGNAAQSALADKRTSNRDKTELLWLLGDIAKAKADKKATKDYYLQAVMLAEENQIYALDRPRARELLNALADSFAELGQKGSECLYRRKAKAL